MANGGRRPTPDLIRGVAIDVTAARDGSFWVWLGAGTCAELIGGFKVGWC